MAKSQIIKDIANDTVPIEATLTRLKIILSEFDKPELIQWVNNELSGYEGHTDAQLPGYRKGNPSAYALISGYEMGVRFSNRKVPLDGLNDLMEKENVKLYITNPIEALESSFADGRLVQKLPTSAVERNFIKIVGIASVTEAYIDFGDAQSIANVILPAVKQKIVDILLLLEKEFGNLDEYDIQTVEKSKDELEEIADKISKIIGIGDMNITVNNNGSEIQNNIAGGNAMINAVQSNGIDLKVLIEAVRREAKNELSPEDEQAVADNLDVIESELAQPTSRKALLKTALTGLRAIKGTAEFGAAVVALTEFVQTLL